MRSRVRLAALAALLAASCDKNGAGTTSSVPGPSAKLTVTSSALHDGQPVPKPYACTDYDHLGHSPPLAWTAGPTGTVGYAITVIDPDAKDFAHWGLVGVPASTLELPDGASPGGALPAGATDLANDFDKPGYGGPCPPPGAPHHYVFTVYALKAPVTATKLDAATVAKIKESALAAGSITATFQR